MPRQAVLAHLLRFELRQLRRNGVFWIALAVYALIGFGAMASDNVSFGGGVGNTMRNAPAVIITILGTFSVFSVLLATIFVAGIALRDFEQRTAELFFATPMKRRDYLLGRYGGGMLAAIAIMLAMAFGLFVGSQMPWLDASRLGPTPWAAFAWSFAVLVLPNLLFVSALIFLLATLTRSMLYSYLSVIAFFVLWTMSGFLTRDLDSRWIGSLIDPSGGSAIGEQLRYWSSAQLNGELPHLTGELLGNRALWLGIAVLLLVAAFRLFRADREGLVLRKRKPVRDEAPMAAAAVPNASVTNASTVALPKVALRNDWRAHWRQYLHQSWFDLRDTVRGAPFIVMLVLGLLLVFAVIKSSGQLYGTDIYPVTRQMLFVIAGGMSLFLIIIVTFYAGEMIWRERSLRVAEATDAYATPDWVPLAAKLTALTGVIVLVLMVCALFTMGYQLTDGYDKLEPLLYAKGLLLELVPFVLMAVLAVFLQVVSGNKFVGYVLMIGFLISRAAMGFWDLDHVLYNYAKASPTPYSDMNGYGHFIGPWLWFRAYWGVFAVFLLGLATAFWPRGTSLSWRDRVKTAKLRLRSSRPLLATLAVALLAFAGLGGWIYYNADVLNRYVPGDLAKQQAADYEKTYRKYLTLPQPRVTDIRADVDIFPKTRSVDIRGHYAMQNKTGQPIAQLHVTIDPDIDVRRLDFPTHALVSQDKISGYTIYKLETPLAPGATMDFDFTLHVQPHGFPLSGGDTAIVYNGTFFNNASLMPQFGYNAGRQLQDRNDRRKYGLPDLPPMPPIDDRAQWNNSYISSNADWVNFETTVSTSSGQIALAPGYLQKQWTRDGRHYYHYKSEAKLVPFFSWLSADWQVKRDHWNDVSLEVYYDPKHAYNVDRMIYAAKKSLAYYSKNFSPYQFRQLRILEFPGYASFAQSFANTIPYSETVGFIADLRDKQRDRLRVLRHRARGRPPVVGAPGDRRQCAGRDHAVRVAGAVLVADGHAARIRRAQDAQVPQVRAGQLPVQPRHRTPPGRAACAQRKPAVHPLPQGFDRVLCAAGRDRRGHAEPHPGRVPGQVGVQGPALPDHARFHGRALRRHGSQVPSVHQGSVRAHRVLGQPYRRGDGQKARRRQVRADDEGALRQAGRRRQGQGARRKDRRVGGHRRICTPTGRRRAGREGAVPAKAPDHRCRHHDRTRAGRGTVRSRYRSVQQTG